MNATSSWDKAADVENTCWQLRFGDYKRSLNRARLNDHFNGNPPFSPDEVQENHIEFNVPTLTGPRVLQVARQQYYQAFMKPGKFFGCRTDSSKVPRHKRAEVNTIVTGHVNRIMKRSPVYFEVKRSKFAQTILHGIGPSSWDDRYKWCCRPIGIEDVLVPSQTLLTMENLPFFAIYRSYTGAQLRKLTSGPQVDPGWNMPLVEYMIKWVDSEGQRLMGTTWPEIWSPEKQEERLKSDAGIYSVDAIPTIDFYDFYFWSDEGKRAGWRRRLVLDTYGSPGAGGITPRGEINYGAERGKSRYGDVPADAKGFLYDGGKRVYGTKVHQLIHFQFADLSAVAPFRYHSVRGLGFLLWAICHVQNRLYNAGLEATFEELMQYFRVKSMDDVERVLALRLVNRAFLDESTQFIPKEERWQTNLPLLEYAYGQNEQIIREDASSFAQRQDYSEQKERKTRFQVMAELNAASTLVSTGLLQAYNYENYEYQEDFRRFCVKNSRDPDVREFRVACLRDGVPEEVLVPEAWDVSSEQVMGAGNKTMEMAISQQLMEMRNAYDPDAQRTILRNVTLAVTDSAALTEELVPDKPVPGDSSEDAQRAAAVLLMGLPMTFKQGVAHALYAEGLLAAMQTEIGKIASMQENMATPDQIMGLLAIAGEDLQGKPTSPNGIAAHIKQLEQDKGEEQRVKQYTDVLTKLLNEVKGYAQRLHQHLTKQAGQNGQGGIDPKDRAKVAAMLMTAKAKADNTRESHGARTAQKQIQFEQTQRQKDQQHQQDLAHKAQDAQLDLHKKAAETALDLQAEHAKNRMRATASDDDA
jgi:hypothetical protein